MMVMVPIDLDIDMLRCFMEVDRTKSFTKAGKNIGLTQSGVSEKIRRLEARIADVLGSTYHRWTEDQQRQRCFY